MTQHQIGTKKFERGLFTLVSVLILLCLLIVSYYLWQQKRSKLPIAHPVTVIAYVDNKLCLSCHQPQARDWMASHHARAMAKAKQETVLGDFNQTSFKRDGYTTRFFKNKNQFYVHTQGPDGKLTDFRIVYTIGVAPLQQYLIELPGGRLQNLTIAWDVQHQRWFDLYPQEKTPPGDILHWAGRYQNANGMCIACHTTNYQKNYVMKTDSYTSTWSEPNVSCQSCHGPGEQHIQWAKNSTKQDNATKHKGLVVDFKQSGTETVVETCGICHARRSELTPHPKVGQPFMDNYLPALLTEGLYYPDGQQQAEVYVYHSFRQSKMYQMGVSCVDCHQPHTGKLKAQGNAVCTQCHSPTGDKRFKSAAKLYDDPAHTFHLKGSSGSQCVNCHMPAKKYMQIHARPDHSIRIPRPDLSVKLGTPNACTQCHTQQSPAWAASAVAKWVGHSHYPLHYGEIIAAGRAGSGEQALVVLAHDKQQPSVVRATALDLLSHYGQESIQASIEGLQNASPEIRRAAVTGLERLPAAERLSYLVPLLKDPIRAVRIEAARVLSMVPANLFDPAARQSFDAALAELVASENLSLDMPASHFNLGVLNENQGQFTQAEKDYQHALYLDPDFTAARLNLVQLYARLNRYAEAESVLRTGIKRLPTQGELYYSLGLLLAEENQLPAALDAFKQAAHLLPKRARIHYNYALALQHLGQRDLAERELLTAHHLEPNNSTFIYALAVFYAQAKNWQQALYFAKQLEKLNPNDAQVEQFVQQIKSEVNK